MGLDLRWESREIREVKEVKECADRVWLVSSMGSYEFWWVLMSSGEFWWVAVRPQKIPIRTYQNLIEPIPPHKNLIFSTLSLESLENIRSLGTPKKLTSLKSLNSLISLLSLY